MMPALLLHSMATPEFDATGCLAAAVELGLDGIELIVDAEYRCALRPDATSAAVSALAAQANAEGVTIGAVSSYARDFDPHRDQSRLLLQAIDIAQALSAPAVRVLAGSQELNGREWDAAAARFAEGLQPLLDTAAAAGVRLELENHMDSLATTARRTAELAVLIDHPALSIIYDPSNLAFMHAEAPALAVELQAPWISRVHAKNFELVGGERHPAELDGGVVTWAGVADALAARAIDVESMTFEYERRWFDLAPATIALPPQIAFLRSLLRVEEGAPS